MQLCTGLPLKRHARPNDDGMGCIYLRFWPIALDRIEIDAWERHNSAPLEQGNLMICNMIYLGHLVTMTSCQGQKLAFWGRQIWQRLRLRTDLADIGVKEIYTHQFSTNFPKRGSHCHKMSGLSFPISKSFISLLKTWPIWHKRAQNGKKTIFRGKKKIVSQPQTTIATKVNVSQGSHFTQSLTHPIFFRKHPSFQ